MAFEYYGIFRGETEFNVHEGAATTGADVEVRVNLATNMTMAEVQQAMTMLKQVMLKNISNKLIP